MCFSHGCFQKILFLTVGVEALVWCVLWCSCRTDRLWAVDHLPLVSCPARPPENTEAPRRSVLWGLQAALLKSLTWCLERPLLYFPSEISARGSLNTWPFARKALHDCNSSASPSSEFPAGDQDRRMGSGITLCALNLCHV